MKLDRDGLSGHRSERVDTVRRRKTVARCGVVEAAYLLPPDEAIVVGERAGRSPYIIALDPIHFTSERQFKVDQARVKSSESLNPVTIRGLHLLSLSRLSHGAGSVWSQG